MAFGKSVRGRITAMELEDGASVSVPGPKSTISRHSILIQPATTVALLALRL